MCYVSTFQIRNEHLPILNELCDDEWGIIFEENAVVDAEYSSYKDYSIDDLPCGGEDIFSHLKRRGVPFITECSNGGEEDALPCRAVCDGTELRELVLTNDGDIFVVVDEETRLPDPAGLRRVEQFLQLQARAKLALENGTASTRPTRRRL